MIPAKPNAPFIPIKDDDPEGPNIAVFLKKHGKWPVPDGDPDGWMEWARLEIIKARTKPSE